jgi:septal ring factor EnvC (AmiA/AmiB activator)
MRHISCALVAVYFLLFAAVCSAAESVIVTEEELSQLSQIISESRQLNQKSLTELKLVKNELEQSKNELTQAQLESEQLRTELTMLSQTSKLQTYDLQRANASLQAYADEEKKKLEAQRRTIKLQRTGIFILLGVGAIYVLRN